MKEILQLSIADVEKIEALAGLNRTKGLLQLLFKKTMHINVEAEEGSQHECSIRNV